MDTIQMIADYQLVSSGEDTIVTIDSGLVTGTTYRFVVVAVNVFGSSDQSEELRVAAGAKPDTPNAP